MLRPIVYLAALSIVLHGWTVCAAVWNDSVNPNARRGAVARTRNDANGNLRRAYAHCVGRPTAHCGRECDWSSFWRSSARLRQFRRGYSLAPEGHHCARRAGIQCGAAFPGSGGSGKLTLRVHYDDALSSRSAEAGNAPMHCACCWASNLPGIRRISCATRFCEKKYPIPLQYVFSLSPESTLSGTGARSGLSMRGFWVGSFLSFSSL